MKKALLSLFFLALFGGQARFFAQEYIYKQFTTADGLPSSEVYHVFQDSKGYIWFATDNGVSKYNGYEFENFDINDGLATNSVSEIYEDNWGKLWFIGINSKLSYLQNDSIHQFKYNNLLLNNFKRSSVSVKKGFYIDSLENIYISVKSNGVIKISKDGIVEKLEAPKKSATQIIHELPNKTKITSIIDSRPINTSTLIIKKTSAFNVIQLDKKQRLFPHHVYLHQININSFFYTSGTFLYKVENNKRVFQQEFDKSIIWSNLTKDNKIWVCPMEEGVYLLKTKNKSFSIEQRLLKGKSVSSIVEDRHGGYWFTTLNSGVYYLQTFDLKVWNILNNLDRNKVKCVETYNDIIWVGYNNNTISRIERDKIVNLDMKLPYSFGVNDLYFDTKKGQLIAATSGYLYKIKKNEIVKIKNNYPLIAPKDVKAFSANSVCSDNFDGYWIGGGQGFFHLKKDIIDFDSRFDKNFFVRVNSIKKDKSGIILLGCIDGLRIYKNKKIEHLGLEYPKLNVAILDIIEYKNSLILATKGNGILFFDGSNVYEINQKDGLISNSITCLAVSGNSIWAGSLNGLCRIPLNQQLFSKRKKKCLLINEFAGIEIFDIKANPKRLLIATNKGLADYKYKEQSTNENYPLLITQVRVNGSKIPLPKKLNLIDKNNSLSIEYEALSFRRDKKTQYKYKLQGLDTNWIQTTERIARYYYLKPGNYKFYVSVKNKIGNWQTPTLFHFNIFPSIWQTIAFKVAIVIFILSSLTLYVKYQFLLNRNELILKQKVYSYMGQAVKAQIRPHFVFNTLNSINKFIIENNRKDASSYLTKFSKLIRKVLEHSQNESISLSEELYALELYMEIEAMRLKNKFTYTISVADDINTSKIKVPSLVLQPFVENSIWHGIQPLDKKGIIKIRIRKNATILEAEIIDNGIGRAKALELNKSKKTHKKSIGVKITYKRLDLLAKQLKSKANIQYTDLYSKSTCIGTKVKICLPII